MRRKHLKIIYYTDGYYYIGTPDEVSVCPYLIDNPWVDIDSIEDYIVGKTKIHAVKNFHWYKPEEKVYPKNWVGSD